MVTAKQQSLLNMRERYGLYGINKIGYVDIEATSLKAEIGHALSIVNVVRTVNKRTPVETRVYQISKKELDSALRRGVMDPDKRIVEEFFQDTVDCDLLIGHWFHGRKRFDMPFLRTRAFLMDIDKNIPNYGYWKFGDTWRQGSNTMNSMGYKLGRLGEILKASVDKTALSGTDWWLAAHGMKSGTKYVVDHNVKDCIITMKVHKSLERLNPIPGSYV